MKEKTSFMDISKKEKIESEINMESFTAIPFFLSELTRVLTEINKTFEIMKLEGMKNILEINETLENIEAAIERIVLNTKD